MKKNWKAEIAVTIAMLLGVCSIQNGNHWMFPFSEGGFCCACCIYATSKGRSHWWGMFGLLSLPGILPITLLKDRSPVPASPRGTIPQAADEAEIYKSVADEIQKGDIHKGVWAKAWSDAAGDAAKAQALYIKYRVQALGLERAAHPKLPIPQGTKLSSFDESVLWFENFLIVLVLLGIAAFAALCFIVAHFNP